MDPKAGLAGVRSGFFERFVQVGPAYRDLWEQPILPSLRA